LLPRLDRLAEALESRPSPPLRAADTAVDQLASIRRAIRDANWAIAEELVRAFVESQPDHPEGSRLAAELAGSKQTAAQSLTAKLDAARDANDPERVLELRDALVPLLHEDPLRTLDRDLARWFMTVIHKR